MVGAFTQVLDVAIGLIFVFLLVSLIVTQVNDKLSEWLRMRAKGLEEGLRKFVVGDQNLIDTIYQNPLVASLVPEDSMVTKLIDKIPGVNSRLLRTDEKQPVRISAQTFATVLFDMLIPNDSGQTTVDKLATQVQALPANVPMRDPIIHVISTTSNDINQVRKNIENWFDAAMVNSTKAYQAHMARIALTLSIIIAVGLNIDTISLARILWTDADLRATLTAEANNYAQNSPQQQNALQKLDELGLPIGWSWGNATGKPFCFAANDWYPRPQPGANVPAPVNEPCNLPPVNAFDSLLKILGWAITGFAGAQGAPFWFDILKKVTNR